jgi:hypothetical protein
MSKINFSKIEYLLWDVDKSSFVPADYPEFLADRIAEKGNFDDLNWYFKEFSFEAFLARVLTSPNTSPRTKNFWKNFIKYNEIEINIKEFDKKSYDEPKHTALFWSQGVA